MFLTLAPVGRSNSTMGRQVLSMRIRTKEALLLNCDLLLRESIVLYRANCFPRSCFLAMTAIEEAGKLLLWLSPPPLKGPSDFSQMSQDEVQKLFRDHPAKAAEATVTLLNNAEASSRYAAIPGASSDWTSCLKKLIEAKCWMDLRNSCLYVDVSTETGESISPQETVCVDCASYMICMGHEVVADLTDAWIEEEQLYHLDKWLRFKSDMDQRRNDFMKYYGGSFKWEQCRFLR